LVSGADHKVADEGGDRRRSKQPVDASLRIRGTSPEYRHEHPKRGGKMPKQHWPHRPAVRTVNRREIARQERGFRREQNPPPDAPPTIAIYATAGRIARYFAENPEACVTRSFLAVEISEVLGDDACPSRDLMQKSFDYLRDRGVFFEFDDRDRCWLAPVAPDNYMGLTLHDLNAADLVPSVELDILRLTAGSALKLQRIKTQPLARLKRKLMRG